MAGGDSCPVRDALAAGAGREAPLDSIEGHLTDSIFHAAYRRGECFGRLMESWNFPFDWSGPGEDGTAFVLKIQAFEKGGFEASSRLVNLVKIGGAIEGGGPRGKRGPREQDMQSVIRASGRAKTKVRQLCRNMLATHMVTLTKQEGPATKQWGPAQWDEWDNGGRDQWEKDHGAFMTAEEWNAAFDRFRRSVVRVIGYFPYVAVPERHRKGNLHLHMAWVGKVPVRLLRKIWLAALGGGGGNIDAQFIKVPAGHERSSRIASYISKYVTKSFTDDPRFNKKRYWASKQTLADVRRYVLRADTLNAALDEVRRLLGLDYGKFTVMERGEVKTRNMFMFPDGGGFWINYLPDLHDTGPPF